MKQVTVHEEHSGPSIGQDIGKISRQKADVQGKQDGSDLNDAIIGLQKTVAVGAKKGHAIALLHSHI